MQQDLFETFIHLANRLNLEYNIKPLLYGSLGLEQVTKINLSPMDIDILIPEEFIDDRWEDLKGLMNKLGYKLVDLREHQFSKNKVNIAFAKIEELKEFAGIELNDIQSIILSNTEYKLLNLDQYLQVYRKSSIDGYRKVKKNNKDIEKINLIESILGT